MFINLNADIFEKYENQIVICTYVSTISQEFITHG